jgi:class 3 adenylate cyclase/streptogramin lyase
MPQRRIATVLMLDVVGSTDVAAQLGDARYRELSSRFNRIVRAGLKRFGGREEDHAGDGFFATFAQPDRAIRCAAALAEDVRTLGVEIRSGIHTGQTESQEGKTHGIAVVIGARVMSLAEAGEVLVTSTTKELVTGSGFGFEDFSAHELKGVPGTWQVYAVTGVDDRERGRPLPAAEAAERRAAVHPSTGRERPRHRALMAGAAAGIVAVGILGFMLSRNEPAPSTGTRPTGPRRGFVVQLDPESGDQLASIDAYSPTRALAVGTTPPVSNHAMVVGQGGVWLARIPRYLLHVDPKDADVRSRLILEPGGLSFSINVAEGADAIWVAILHGLLRVNPATDEQRLIVELPTTATTVDVTAGEGAIWMGIGDGSMLRLDPASGRRRWVRGLDSIDEIVAGHGSVWTIDVFGSTVTRYDPETMRPLTTIPISGGVDAIVLGEEKLWALSRALGSLVELDPETNLVGHAVQVGDAPTVLTAGLGAIWVADRDGSIRRVDEETRQVTTIPFGAELRALAVDEETDTLWVDVA